MTDARTYLPLEDGRADRAAPRVSVVMSVFNGERFLAECIVSILAQTYDDFELIIIDDGSTDSTPTILASFVRADDRVRVMRNAGNSGIPVSVNRGLDAAAGELVARMDADDVSPPHRLQVQVAYLDAHPDVAAAGSRYEEFTTDVNVRTPGRIPAGGLRGGNPPFPQSSMLARRTAITAAGAYDPRFNVAEDHDLFLRMAHAGCRFAVLDDTLLHRRLHDDNVSRRRRRLQLEQNLIINVRGMRRYGLRLNRAGWHHLVRTAAFWLFLTLQLRRVIPEAVLRRVFRRPSGRG